MARFSIYIWERRNGLYRRRFNPYIAVAGYELCIDGDGFAVLTPRRSFGFIRGAGFWRRRFS
jgi:hypothetical protein